VLGASVVLLIGASVVLRTGASVVLLTGASVVDVVSFVALLCKPFSRL
jgi:hypothetical protein